MTTPAVDTAFKAGIPALYERHLVPLIFEPYARYLVDRLEGLRPTHVLELAAGTGVVTREMASRFGNDVSITATDLNQSMIDHAASLGTARTVIWRQADALDLPFEDGSFDAVVCQFGAMFFPDKVRGYSEALRVLQPGGTLLLAVWDCVEANDFCATVMTALAKHFGPGKVDFLRRTPHGYYEPAIIRGHLEQAGSRDVRIDTVTLRSVAQSAESVAIGYCQGNPMRLEIESLGEGKLEEATRIATAALKAEYGEGEIEGKIQALVVEARKGT